MIEQDHLFQVATFTKGQIKKLNQAGINTMHELATTDIEYVLGINTIALEKLKAQAKIQNQSAGNAIPRFEIITPAPNEKSGLALLPPHSPLDVFFDIEGYPIGEGGLEYLWRISYFAKGRGKGYKPPQTKNYGTSRIKPKEATI